MPIRRVDAVDHACRLDLPLEHGEERPLVALVGGVLARAQVDVGCDAADVLAIGGVEAGEDADLPDLLRASPLLSAPRHGRNATATAAPADRQRSSVAAALSRAACSARKRRSGTLVVRSAAAR